VTVPAAAGTGLLVGLHVATWGAFKDGPFEGFRLTSYLRSILLATAIAVIITVLAPQPASCGIVLAGTVYALERLTTESWKSILREQDQSRYTIPMRLGFRGRPIDHRPLRYALGAVLATGAAAALVAVDVAQQHAPALPALLVILTVGATGGWATAVGGAWKDAPIEGFSGWKFLRSPSVATAWAVPLSLLTDSWVTLLLASCGFAVATIETYKTFLTGGRPPGKFEGRPIRVHLPALRRLFARQHALLWLAVAAAFTLTLTGPHSGLTGSTLHLISPASPRNLLDVVAISTAAYGALVAYSSRRLAAPQQDLVRI
jgi:hypothetical protein